MKENVLAFPLLVKSECPAILAGIIMPVRRKWRVVPEMTAPCIAYILIYRVSIAVEFPHSGNRHIIPPLSIKIKRKKVSRALIYGLIPAEVPCTVEHEFQSVCLEMRRHRDSVPLEHLRVLPVRHHFLFRGIRQCRERQGNQHCRNQSFHNGMVIVSVWSVVRFFRCRQKESIRDVRQQARYCSRSRLHQSPSPLFLHGG